MGLTLRSNSYDSSTLKENSNTTITSSNIHFPSELIGVGGSITSSGQFYKTKTTNYYYYNEDVIATATTKEEVMDDVINFCKNFCPLGQEGFCDKNTKETCPLGKRIKMEERE